MFKFPRHGSPNQLYCHWLWHAVTVLSDGTVTCGLDDPFKMRDHGNLNSATLREILAGDAIANRRNSLQSGIRCDACSMYEAAAGKNSATLVPSYPYPKRLIVEPSIKCNIRCNNETCNIANSADIVLRHNNFMQWELYCRLIDEIGHHLEELYFYNYGEPFLHPRALDMLGYAKQINPRIRITTSTNGILLVRQGKAERIVAEQLVDFITFTIGGVDQETYVRYHKAGSFEEAMLGMRRLITEKRYARVERPVVHWRYLLFNWNDSDECIAEAQRLREETGVDEFRYMLTASPMEGRSLRRAPGTPGFEAIKPWVAYQEGYSADPFAEAGLWGAEHCQWNGPFSWTGARARVVVTPREGRLLLRLARGGTEAGPKPRVTIRLPWGEIRGEVGMASWQDNTIVLPENYAAPSVPVEVEVEKLFTPMRHGISGDNRELGVMLSLADVTPAPNPYRVSPVPLARISGASRGI
jgi:hypothetical protein